MRRVFLLFFTLIAGSALSRAAEPATTLPFAFVNGFILIKAQLAGRAEPLTFLVDSGASVSVLSVQTARRLHLSLVGAERAHGVGIDVAAYHLKALGVAAAGCDLSKIDLAVDLQNAAPLCGQTVDGLIGADFFENRIVQIDYLQKQLRLLRQSFPADGSAATLPIRRRNGVFCVGVSVNGSQPRWTRLDTGCNDPLHWVVPRVAGQHKSKEVSLGFMTDERDVTKAAVRLGSIPLDGIETSLHGQPLFPDEAGLLGNGLLSRFLITIDVPHRRLLLQPSALE